ncbi:MAG: hypothetical protein VX217_01880, partial [Acidobacteriota bacterium]|nr:hypothetical protein [Acidobacteriota bacterium]
PPPDPTTLPPGPYSQPRGQVKSVDTISIEILREVRRLKDELNGNGIVIRTSSSIATALQQSERTMLRQIRSEVQAPVSLLPDAQMHQEQFEVVCL